MKRAKLSLFYIGKKEKKKSKSYMKKDSRKWAREIMKSISYCEACTRDDCKLEVHHINRNPLDNTRENLIKLCVICHYEIHKDEAVGKIMYKRIKHLL
jgi:hypothetical protein